MSETENSHSRHGGHDRHPYWKSAHRDWRVWVAVGSMLAAMTMYVMSDNLGLRLRRQPGSASSVVGR